MTDTGNAQDPASTSSDSPPASPLTEERVLRRSDEGRMLTGVCAGLGRYAGIDPVLFRVGFAVLVLGSGIGIMLYIAAFLLMREANGGPGYMEQWTRRTFDSETVLALLTGVFAFGLIINLSSDGIGTGTVVVGTLFAIVLLAAHARGVDLLAVARSLPDRLRGRRVPRPSGPPPAAFAPAPPPYPAAHPQTGSMSTAPYAAQAPAAGPAPVPAPQGGGTAPAGDIPPAGSTPLPADTSSTEDPRSPESAPPYAETAPVADPRSSGNAPPYAGTAPVADGPPRGVFPAGGMPPSPRPAARPSFDSSGEPFSPYGPYQPLDPRRRQQQYSPYDLSGYGGPVRTAPRPKRPRSFVGGVTLCLAMIVGGIIMAIQATSGSVNMTIAGGAMLITIGAGLLVAAWFGRGAALVAAGTIISIALVAGSTLTDMPKRFGSYHWEPTTLSEIAADYDVGVGEGTLDLGDLTFPPGSRTVVDASVSVGQISVILPPTVRVEVNGYTKLGDVKIDHAVEGGADIRHDKILEPETAPKGDVATVVLNVKAGIGDVEVRRAA
ncbi:PspC domain-containing protein [Streptosporangium roseum]|uniref:PspC domain-containing protein n=1 Tax=Streptosporangium roseum TaxID=2001 RepID=UPI0009DE185A|nr:PspC domain-containing protein [Streptosporangium roseum]